MLRIRDVLLHAVLVLSRETFVIGAIGMFLQKSSRLTLYRSSFLNAPTFPACLVMEVAIRAVVAGDEPVAVPGACTNGGSDTASAVSWPARTAAGCTPTATFATRASSSAAAGVGRVTGLRLPRKCLHWIDGRLHIVLRQMARWHRQRAPDRRRRWSLRLGLCHFAALPGR